MPATKVGMNIREVGGAKVQRHAKTSERAANRARNLHCN
jgi:hypothetical protein